MNKKNHFYGNVDIFNSFFFNIFIKKKELKFDEYNTKGQLYKVYLKKNRQSELMPEMNYYFYSDFFKNLKKKSKNIVYNNYIKNANKDILVFSPSYMFKSQFFSNKSLFDDVLFNFKIKGFFIHKNFYKNFYEYNSSFYKKHLTGYNYYIIKSNFEKCLNIYKIVDDKEYNGVGKVKFFLNNSPINTNLKNNLNLFVLFNLVLLQIVEIYKITKYLHINIFLKN